MEILFEVVTGRPAPEVHLTSVLQVTLSPPSAYHDVSNYRLSFLLNIYSENVL